MRTLQEIKNTLSSHKSRLFQDYPIKSMAIFGSYSRREQNDSSDLDILVEFSDKIGVRFIDLAEELETGVLILIFLLILFFIHILSSFNKIIRFKPCINNNFPLRLNN